MPAKTVAMKTKGRRDHVPRQNESLLIAPYLLCPPQTFP
jgi:hypothetical protein